MIKMAAMSIYAKKLPNSSSLGPKGQWIWNLRCSIEYLQSCLNDAPGVDIDLFYGKVKFGPLCFFMGKS